MAADWKYEFAAVKGAKGLSILGRAYFDRVVSTLADGVECVLTLTPKKNKRSNNMNRGMWGPLYDQVCEIILSKEGYRRDEWPKMKPLIHEGLCGLYGGYELAPGTKQKVRKFRTSDASGKELGEFLEWVAQYMAEEYGEAIALPGER